MYYITGTINEYTYDWATLNHAVERQRQLRAMGLKSQERKDWPEVNLTLPTNIHIDLMNVKNKNWSDEGKKLK